MLVIEPIPLSPRCFPVDSGPWEALFRARHGCGESPRCVVGVSGGVSGQVCTAPIQCWLFGVYGKCL